MAKITIAVLTLSLLSACAGEPIYAPGNAGAFGRNADPYPNCPAGSVVACDREGGARVGVRLYNCRCVQ